MSRGGQFFVSAEEQEVPRVEWLTILDDISSLAEQLRNAGQQAKIPLGSSLQRSEDFESDPDANRRNLATLLDKIREWAEATLETYDSISVLGL